MKTLRGHWALKNECCHSDFDCGLLAGGVRARRSDCVLQSDAAAARACDSRHPDAESCAADHYTSDNADRDLDAHADPHADFYQNAHPDPDAERDADRNASSHSARSPEHAA